MVNKAIVLRLMGNIEGYLNDLLSLENLSLPEFQDDIKSQRFTERTLQIAHFRNKLVHYYEKIDSEIVYSIATEKRDDIVAFLECIRSWITDK